MLPRLGTVCRPADISTNEQPNIENHTSSVLHFRVGISVMPVPSVPCYHPKVPWGKCPKDRLSAPEAKELRLFNALWLNHSVEELSVRKLAMETGCAKSTLHDRMHSTRFEEWRQA